MINVRPWPWMMAAAAALGVGLLSAVAPDTPAPPPAPAGKPALYVVGDSTANSPAPIQGWGTPFGTYFDPAKVTVLNKARGGRSSRSYVHEGLWDAVAKDLKPGDFVLLQFGHNDGGTPSAARAGDRPSLPGLGEETKDFPNPAGQTETVHTFGFYMRKMIADTKARGATIIVLSCTVRNMWSNGKADHGPGSFGPWAAEVAKSQSVPFLDLSSLTADKYDLLGQEKVAAYYGPTDKTHSTPAGADYNAASVVSGLKALKDSPFVALLSDKGRAVATADAKYVTQNAPEAEAKAGMTGK
jgi:lysophospholipase L1-like esterase